MNIHQNLQFHHQKCLIHDLTVTSPLKALKHLHHTQSSCWTHRFKANQKTHSVINKVFVSCSKAVWPLLWTAVSSVPAAGVLTLVSPRADTQVLWARSHSVPAGQQWMWSEQHTAWRKRAGRLHQCEYTDWIQASQLQKFVFYMSQQGNSSSTDINSLTLPDDGYPNLVPINEQLSHQWNMNSLKLIRYLFIKKITLRSLTVNSYYKLFFVTKMFFTTVATGHCFTVYCILGFSFGFL